MKCANCEAVNPDGARFCSNCGNALTIACVNCGTPLTPNAKFCFNCGHPVGSPTGGAPVSVPVQAATVPTQTTTAPAALESETERLQRYIPKEFLSKLEAARANRSMEGERRNVTVL